MYAASYKLLCLSLYRHLLTSRDTNICYNLLGTVPKYPIQFKFILNRDYYLFVSFFYLFENAL